MTNTAKTKPKTAKPRPKTDRRILRTRDALGDAMMALLHEKSFDQITVQEVSAEGLRAIGPCTATLAAAEQLEAHRRAVTLRLAALERMSSGSPT